MIAPCTAEYYDAYFSCQAPWERDFATKTDLVFPQNVDHDIRVATFGVAMSEYLRKIAPLGDSSWETLQSALVRRTLAKNEHFNVVGRVADTIGFLQEGCVRAYYTTEDGKEYNKHLFVAPAVIGDYASLLTGEPVAIPQQALTRCTVLTADFRALDRLTDTHPDLERFARRFAELAYIIKEKRELELVTLHADERYELMLERLPGIEQYITQYHIASYLGISATQLSRIRAQRRKRR